MHESSAIQELLDNQGFVVVDGGLATELEARGHDLDHPLWSARLLDSEPDAIRSVHQSYFEAGADCVVTASYQASIPGLVANGLPLKQAERLIALSVTLACEARDAFLSDAQCDATHTHGPLVAASVGPYGAYLADGSEYRGDYGISSGELRSFHERRWHVLADTAADVLACETIPSFPEAGAILELLAETPHTRAWLSFSCKDGEHICDGTPLAECAAMCEGVDQLEAVGINCTAPRHITSLIRAVRAGAPSKPVIVYPNSGERYDAKTRRWTGTSEPQDFGQAAVEWFRAGAKLIGGCCRTGPAHVRAIRAALLKTQAVAGNGP